MKSPEVVVKIDDETSTSTSKSSGMSGKREFSFGRNHTDADQDTILPPLGNDNNNKSRKLLKDRSSIRVSFKAEMPKRRRSTAYNDLGEISSSSSGNEMEDEDDEEEEYHQIGISSMRSRRDTNNNNNNNCKELVVRSSSNATFDRQKTRSRLMDPPLDRSGKSGFISMKSGVLEEEDDLDPFMEEDIPEDYMKERMSAVVILQWVSLVVLVGALICSFILPALQEEEVWKFELWKWQVFVIVLICGRLVSGWWVKLIIVVFIERNNMLRKRVLYFVYGVREAVINCMWLALVLLAWHILFDTSHQRVLHLVKKVLICFLVSSFIWLLKTLIVRVLASSFHVSAFFDRIQESLFNQFVIKTLSGPAMYDDATKIGTADSMNSRSRIFDEAGGGVSRDHHDDQGGITLHHLQRLNQKNVSAWNMKRLVKIIRGGALITTLDEQIQDESATQIGSEVQARAAARKIFRNVVRQHSRFIYMDDLLRFMREEEAVKTMNLFEGASENNRISKSDLKNWVVNAFRERRALALTLYDTKSAVNKLRHIVNFVVSIIISFISLIILNIATSKFLLFISSQIMLVAFVFGNSCKNVFESIIFLFVVHPYDVGDRCEIDNVQMNVEEMNILTTVFLRHDNQKIVYPNFILFTKAIHNYYRSPDMGDSIEFSFHLLTPPDKITQVRQRILSYIELKKEHWYPNPTIILKDVDTLSTLRIAIWVKHRMNHQDMKERWKRRALLVEECVNIFRDLDIDYRYLHCNVNVTSLPRPI